MGCGHQHQPFNSNVRMHKGLLKGMYMFGLGEISTCLPALLSPAWLLLKFAYLLVNLSIKIVSKGYLLIYQLSIKLVEIICSPLKEASNSGMH